MKKSTLLFVPLFLFSLNLFSQTFVCGDNQEEIIDKFYSHNNNLLPNSTTDDPSIKHVFNLRFHIVYNSDGITRTNSNGQPGLTIGENEVLNAVRDLNSSFNQFNIFLNIMEWIKLIIPTT